MKTQKYEARLPQLRVSEDIWEKVQGWAFAHQITIAEAHRQILARGLHCNTIRVPVVGRIITNESGKPEFVINAGKGAA